jgi:hypothetical protein
MMVKEAPRATLFRSSLGEPGMTFQGRVENGTIVLDEAVALPDGARVQVEVVDDPASHSASESTGTLFERLSDVVGIAGDGLPDDLAVQHDHYAHGAPKR